MRNALIVVVLSLGLAACAHRSTPPVEGTVNAPDEVPIAYEVGGDGEVALVFVHCWSCDRTFWQNQVEEFSGDYRVVSIDLAGHGESGRDRANWTISGLAGDVEAVVEALGLDRVVLIGHSMGGPVSLAAAARMPERVEAIIAVDTLHDAEQDFPEEQRTRIVSAFRNDFEGAMANFVPMMFRPDADPTLIRMVIDHANRTDRRAAVELMDDFGNLDLPEMFRAAGVPIRAINAAPAPPIQPPTAVETNRRYSDFDAVLVDDVGHYIQLEKPEVLNAHIRAILQDLGL